jgi:hypothetical protein
MFDSRRFACVTLSAINCIVEGLQALPSSLLATLAFSTNFLPPSPKCLCHSSANPSTRPTAHTKEYHMKRPKYFCHIWCSINMSEPSLGVITRPPSSRLWGVTHLELDPASLSSSCSRSQPPYLIPLQKLRLEDVQVERPAGPSEAHLKRSHLSLCISQSKKLRTQVWIRSHQALT